MKKLILLAVTGLAGLSLAACGNGASKPQTKAEISSSKASSKQHQRQSEINHILHYQPSNQEAAANKKLATAYDRLHVAPLRTHSGGSTTAQVEALLGKPDKTSNDKKTHLKTYQWHAVKNNKYASTLLVEFDQNMVESKMLMNIGASNKITDSQAKSFKKGTSMAVIKKQLGLEFLQLQMGGEKGNNNPVGLEYVNNHLTKVYSYLFTNGKLLSISTEKTNPKKVHKTNNDH